MIKIIFCIIFACTGFFGGAYANLYITSKMEIEAIPVYTSGNLEFHFLELGNNKTGDSTYIKCGDIDILIDAGSQYDSAEVIISYLNERVVDKLDYVIVTHGDFDHIAGFANKNGDSIFDAFEVGIIIDFENTNKTTVAIDNYNDELNAEVANGAKHYTAWECVNKLNGASDVYNISKNVNFQILNQKYYNPEEKSQKVDENNYSVCTLFTHGERNFLFTGDLCTEGEASLLELNDIPQCELYKLAHHGSDTSNSQTLLEVIRPKICVATCVAGNYEYTQINNNNFPKQDIIERISQFTDAVYVTTQGIPKLLEDGKYKNDGFKSWNGNIVVTSSTRGVSVECSAIKDNLLKSGWFNENNRKIPDAWK